MKVLHILNELRPSGAEQMLRIAAPLWRSRGCDLHILSIAEETGEFTEQLSSVGWNIHSTGKTSGTVQLFQSLRKSILRIQPDILHINPEGYGPLLPLVCALSRKPMFRTVHNSFGFVGNLKQRKTIERWLARKLGVRFIAISQSVFDNEQDRFSNPCTLLWNWIDTDRFHPPTPEQRSEARKRFNISPEQTLLVSVGNGSDVKNYKAVIEALAELANPKLLYCQVGNAHPQCSDENLATKLGIQDQVRFCGPSQEILEWLWAADLFVMPSIFEGFGLAAVEALATGLDCIFADCPGLVDFKAFDIPAAWVPPTGSEFAAAIQRALQTSPSPEAQTSQADKVHELFSADHRAMDYFMQWQQAHNRHSPSA